MAKQITQLRAGMIALVVAACSSGGASNETPAPMAATSGTAALAGQWTGTVTHDVTQVSGPISFALSGDADSVTGTVSLPGAPNLPVSLRQTGDELSGSIDASYTDPGCSCAVVSEVQGTLQGATITGSVSARDARTGQWNFSSFTVTRRGR